MTENLTIWGREFNLQVSYDYYDEPIPQAMKDALESFIASPSCIEQALPKLNSYCLDNDSEELLSLSRTAGVDNIFRYVLPEYLYVLEPDESRNAIHRVALMCDYRFDPEEGLALVFENEELADIVPQSSVC